MVSVGRGRGRGWADDVEGPLPRPGRSYSGNTDYANLVNIMHRTNTENALRNNKEISKLISEAAKKGDLQGIFDELYKHASKDREFGHKLLVICIDPVIKEIRDSENVNLYRILVNHFQVEFERREEAREKNLTQFHYNICLFSKFLKSLMSAPCTYLVLQSALLVYMEMLLETASADDIEIFSEQIVVHGANFSSSYKEKTDNLMITARQVLIKKDLSVTSRQMLLYAIDLHSRNFNSLPTDLLKFYKPQFGKNNNFFDSLCNDEHNRSGDKVSKKKHQPVSVNNRGLRAIRGSGAADGELNDHQSIPVGYQRLRSHLVMAVAENNKK